MLELTKKYFREDLTEAEEQALSDVLRDSVDEAEDFVKLAEEAYYRYGFSQPRWPEPPPTPGAAGFGFKPWLGLFIMVLGGMAVLWVWNNPKFFSSFHPQAEIGQVGSPSVSPHPSLQVKEKSHSIHPASSEEGQNMETSQGIPMKGKDEEKGASGAEGMVGSRVPEESSLTPINLEEAPSRKYSSLSMQVNLVEPATLVVRVLDMRGLEVTPLYQGNLGAGHWLFEWDGKLRQGGRAAAGYYQIEVRAGSVVQRKNLEIR